MTDTQYIERAIRDAEKGGWKVPSKAVNLNDYLEFQMYIGTDILLDPLFWSCLGKSLGWEDANDWEAMSDEDNIEAMTALQSATGEGRRTTDSAAARAALVFRVG